VSDSDDDVAWFAKFREGDDEWLGDLLQASRSTLEARVERLLEKTWVRRRVCASDIVQQAFVQALQRRGQFKGTTRTEWEFWLRMIALRILMLEFREARFPFLPLFRVKPGHRNETPIEFLDSTSSVWVKVNRELVTKTLNELINQLAVRDQQIVRKRNDDMLGWDQIGKDLGCSGASVRNRYYRVLVPILTDRAVFLLD